MPRSNPLSFSPKLVTGALFALLGIIIALGVALFYYQKSLVHSLPEADTRNPPAQSPLSEAEFEAGEIQKNITAESVRLLNSYGWKDQAQGIAHIPIARAMKLKLEKSEKSR